MLLYGPWDVSLKQTVQITSGLLTWDLGCLTNNYTVIRWNRQYKSERGVPGLSRLSSIRSPTKTDSETQIRDRCGPSEVVCSKVAHRAFTLYAFWGVQGLRILDLDSVASEVSCRGRWPSGIQWNRIFIPFSFFFNVSASWTRVAGLPDLFLSIRSGPENPQETTGPTTDIR